MLIELVDKLKNVTPKARLFKNYFIILRIKINVLNYACGFVLMQLQ